MKLKEYRDDLVQIANKTSRTNGASARNADGSMRSVVGNYVLNNVSKDASILDFGAGKDAVQSQALRDSGFKNVTAYDFGANMKDGLHDPAALSRQYDVVFASNVLNVSSDEEMLIETLSDIFKACKTGGKIIFNYPSSPRKAGFTAQQVEDIIMKTYSLDKAPKVVASTKSAPVWEIVKNNSNLKLKEDLDDIDIDSILRNPIAIYIVDDARKQHYITDEIIEEDYPDEDAYPEEQLLRLDDVELIRLPEDKIKTLTNSELLARICKLDRDLLTNEQKLKAVEYFKEQSSKANIDMVAAYLDAFKKCESVFVTPSRKNKNFIREFNVKPDDYKKLLAQIKPTDYVKNVSSANIDTIGDNLMIFHHKDAKLNDKILDLDIYVKVDVDKTDGDCIYYVSFHKSNVFESLDELTDIDEALLGEEVKKLSDDDKNELKKVIDSTNDSEIIAAALAVKGVKTESYKYPTFRSMTAEIVEDIDDISIEATYRKMFE